MEGVFTKNVSGFLTVPHINKSWEQRRSRATVMVTAMRASNETSPISK